MCILKEAKVIILVPYPAQGHVTPMLKLGYVLADLDLKPLLVVPEFIHRRLSSSSSISLDDGKLSCISIPDGLDEETPRDFFAIEMSMEKHMPLHLEKFILGQLVNDNGNNNNNNDIVMVVDLLASYAIDVGQRCGIQVVGFWPAMLSVYHLISAIPHLVQSGVVSHESGLPLREGPIQSMSHSAGQPTIHTEHLPWLIGSPSTRTARFKFWIKTLNRSSKLDHLLANTFPDIDNNNNTNNNCLPRILPIGHLINLHDTNKKTSFFEEEFSCLEWLDDQPKGSVVYVSFGSWVSPIGEAKVKSLAMALKASRRPFIWVLGQSWREGLPRMFLDEIKEQGKIVSWAPQLEILGHEAVGFYLTHCGWNSTLEAIQHRKCMLCFPVAGDQFLNCAYIVKTWKIGVRLNGLEEHDVAEGFARLANDLDGMNQRIMALNERLMGFDAYYRTINNFKEFIDDLKIHKKLH